MVKSVTAGQERGEIGGYSQIRGVPERGHAAETDQQIQAECEDRRDQDLACEIDIKIARQPWQQEKQGGKKGAYNPLHATTRPNRPCGRNAMTKIIGKNRMI